MRADLGFIGIDQRIDRQRVDEAFFGQYLFERFDAQFRIAQRPIAVRVMMVLIVVVVVAMMVAHA